MRDPLPLLAAIVVVAILALAQASGRFEMAVYALSFWHYLVYALAFLWRRISLERFKRDSVILKTLSLAMLAAVLLTTVPGVFSAVVMAAGFALNIAAARALGADRTYYGLELEAIPPKRITAFPYSMTAHPMLIGNMLAFGGTLLDAEFRQAWWPLGLLHVVLNLLIILMEAYGGENRRNGAVVAIVALAVSAGLITFSFPGATAYALATAVVGLLFGAFIVRRYA